MASAKHKHRVLTTCTRLLFLQLLLVGLAEVVISLYLLFTCKHRTQGFTDVIIIPTHTCSKLVYPTYFGCAIVFSTLSGFGCVGRKATAVLVAIIAVVELSLAVSLWLDHPCSLLHQDDVLHALRDSVHQCHQFHTGQWGSRGLGQEGEEEERPSVDCKVMVASLQAVCNISHLESLMVATTTAAATTAAEPPPPNRVLSLGPHIVSLEANASGSATATERTMNTTAVFRCATCITDTLSRICEANASVLLPAFTTTPFIYLVISLILASVHHRHKRLMLQADQEGKSALEEPRRDSRSFHHKLRASKIRGIRTLSSCLMCLSDSLHRVPSRRKESLDNFYLMKTLPESHHNKLLEPDEETKQTSVSSDNSRENSHIEHVPILLANSSGK